MIHINLLPAQEFEAASVWRKECVIAGVILCLAFAVIARLHVVQSRQLGTALAQVVNLEAEIKHIRKENKEVDTLIKKKELLEQRLKAVTSLTSPQRRSASVRILDDLSRSTPDLLWLTDFTEGKGTAKIQGAAVDNRTIATFARNLSNSLYFQQVEIRETVQEIQNSPSPVPPLSGGLGGIRKSRRGEAGQVKKFLIEAVIPAYIQEQAD